MSTKVEVGVMQKLLVTEVTEMGKIFFVQLDTPEAYQVQDLSREIESHILEQKSSRMNFEPGSKCYARASDGVLYRAFIVNRATANSVTVYFADYGNSEVVENSNIFPPTGNYFNLPTQALCCTLADFIPTQSKWSDEISTVLIENLVNQEVYGIFRSQSSHTHPYQAALQGDKHSCYNVTLYQDEAGGSSYSEMLVSSRSGQFAVCSENVAVGMEEKVFVSFSDSPGRFWLQFSSGTNTLEQIGDALADDTITSTLQPLSQDAIFPGVACCTVFDEDGAFYRVQIIEIGRGDKVKVQFVDYGNSTTVSSSNLCTLPLKLCSVPAQAIQCCLEGVRPIKKDWTKESCEVFASGTINIELDAQFVNELMPEVFNVVLRNPETGSTISEVLVARGCAQSSDPPPLLSETPPTRLIPSLPTQPLPTEYTPVRMEVGETYQLTVTFLESPSVVWGQITKYQPDFSAMMSKMSAIFRDISAIPGLKASAPGQPCAVQFAADKQWYRGRIEEIDDPTKRAKVIFVDFGNTDILKLSSLKQLPAELLLLPTQAVSFSMYGLAPADGGKMWSVKTIESLHKWTSSGVVQCAVVELDGDGYPAVRLGDASGSDIGEEMVRSKLACWKEGRKSRSYQQNRPAAQSSTRGSGSHDGSTRGSGSREGSTRGSGSREGSTRGSGSREGSTRGSGSRDGSTRGSEPQQSAWDGSGSRDSSARGNRRTSPSKHSPHQPEQQSQFQSNIKSPRSTGTGPTPHQPESQHYVPQRLEVGHQYALSVVFVESLHNFYVQLSDQAPQLTSLMDEIANHCSTDAARLPEKLIPGKPVLAQFTDDQEWYRAVITERNQGVSTVKFVDYGNTDTLQDSSLIEIPAHFLSLPSQAILCSLDGVGTQVSAEAAKTTFSDLTLEQEAQGDVRSVSEQSSGPVYTIDLTLADGSKPLTALVEGGHISIPRATLSNLSPLSSPTLTEVKSPSFPTQTHIDVCVSYAKSPSKFFVQLLRNTASLEELTRGIHDVYSGMSQRDEVLFSLDTGVFCVAKFSEDGVWYRARIMSLDGGTVRVRFVDYGNEDSVPASDLKCLRVQFAIEPCFAIHCTLDGLNSDLLQSQDVIEKFSEIVANDKLLVVKFLKPFSSYSEAVPVQLFDTSHTEQDQDVATMLMNLHSNVGLSQSENRSTEGTIAPKASTSGMAHTLMAIPIPEPELNQPLDCTVTHVEGPSQVYCQLSSATPVAESMMDALYDFYAEQNAGVALDNPEIGLMCAALYTDDGSWYRAKITSLTSELATVLYIDYGNSTEVLITDLRVLDGQFHSEPLLALRCSLNGIRPIGGQSEWTNECLMKLNEALLEKKCVLRVISVSNDTFSVQLTVAESGVCISQVLIGDGFAETSEPVKTAAGSSPSIPPYPAQTGGELDVFVTFSDSPVEIYCQRKDHDDSFDQLTEELQRVCETGAAREVEIADLIIGDVMLAQYSEDMAWYRAQVLSISDDGKSVKVKFVDYGNTETTSDIRTISNNLCSLLAQAVPCSLLCGEEYSVNPENENKNCFNELLTADEDGFRLRFVEVGKGDKCSVVQLYRLSDNTNILDYACDLGILLGKSNTCSDNQQKVPPTPEVTSRDSGLEDAAKQVCVDTEAEGFLPVVVAANTSEDGFVSHFETPSSFWVHLASNEGNLESLGHRLAAVYGVATELDELVLPDPKPGQVCCAQFSEDQQWYRGIVDVVDDYGVRVHFIDYGNSETAAADQVKVLKEEFQEIPVQAVHCSLMDIGPPVGTTWPDESIAFFSSLVLNNTVTVRFVDVASSGVWLVELSSEKKDIAMAMVNEGVAVSKIPANSDATSEPHTEDTSDPSLAQGLAGPPLSVSDVTIPTLEFKVGDVVEVYISHLTNSVTEFYCQLADNEPSIDELMASVSDFYTENSPPALLEVGRFCVAQYSGNNAWYRAKILEVRDGGERVEIAVHFVDLGNYETVSPAHVLGLNQNLAALAGQAIRCSLTEDLTLKIPDENMLKFMSVDLNQNYRMCITGCLPNNNYVVELSDLNGTVLNDNFLSPENTEKEVADFKSLPYEVPSSMDVYVSSINSATSFFCQPVQMAAELEGMMTELTETILNKSPPEVQSVVVGMPCLAKFSEDDGWYRARVTSVAESGEVTAHFVDYGNSEVTSVTNLRECPNSLLKEPIQALHCSVFDSSVITSATWTEEDIEKFRSMLGDEVLTLTITGTDPDSGVCVCELSSNGAPINFSPLLSSHVQHEKVPPGGGEELEQLSQGKVSTSDEIANLRHLSSEQLSTTSSVQSSSLPTSGITVTTTDGRIEDQPSRGSEESGEVDSNLGGLAMMNVSTLALQGSSRVSEELSDTESSEDASDQVDDEGEPLIKAPFMLTLSIPEQFEATVVFVENPSFMFLQRVDCQPELDKLSTEIEQYCTSFAEKQQQENFQKGDFVLAQYSDDVWYRAKVVDVREDLNVNVFFIDFGNSESIAPDKMVMCPESYLELPCQAIACSLSNVPRRDPWPEEYKNLIEEQVSEQVMQIKVVHPASEGMRPTVTITDPDTGADVAQKVLDYLQEECDRGNLSNYVIPEEPEEEEVATDTENDEKSATELAAKPVEQDKPEGADVPSPPVVESVVKYVVPERSLKTESSYEVYVVSCESPHSFMLQLVSESDSLNTMTTAIEATYEEKDMSTLTLPCPPTVGDFVCAQFSEDLKWYRARVVSLEPDERRAELLFIDFGNSEQSDVSGIRALAPSLPSHPPFAIECFLAGIEPPAGEGSFSSDAAEHFMEVTGHGETVCKAEVLFTDSAGHYGVNLFGSEGVNVAQSLFNAHLATVLQDTPTTAATLSDADVTPDQSEPLSSGVAPSVANQPELTEDPLAHEDTTEHKDEPEKPVSGLDENSSDQSATVYPTHSLEVGSTYKAIVTSITSLDEFHCQLIDSFEALDVLMQDIASRDYHTSDNTLHVEDPRIGLPVCACFTEDDSWYRAQIIAVLSPDRVRLCYVDYGNSEEVELSRVKRLEGEFAERLAPVVVRCSLMPLSDHDLDPSRPLEGAWDLVWPSECLRHFRELVKEDSEVELVCEGGGEEGGGWRVRVVMSVEGEGEGEEEQSEEVSTSKVESSSTIPETMSDQRKSGSTPAKLDVRSALVSRFISQQTSQREEVSHDQVESEKGEEGEGEEREGDEDGEGEEEEEEGEGGEGEEEEGEGGEGEGEEEEGGEWEGEEGEGVMVVCGGGVTTQFDTKSNEEPEAQVSDISQPDTPPPATPPLWEPAPEPTTGAFSKSEEEGAVNGTVLVRNGDDFEGELDKAAKQVAHRAVLEAEKGEVVTDNRVPHVATDEGSIPETKEEDLSAEIRVAEITTVDETVPKAEKKGAIDEDAVADVSAEEKENSLGHDEVSPGQDSVVGASRED